MSLGSRCGSIRWKFRSRVRDVLVRVKACGIIPNMNAIFSGRLWNHLPPLPASVGLDAAGVIAKAGSEVTDVAVGDRVYVNPWLSCGMCSYCRTGEPMLCSAAAFQGYFGFFLIPSASSWIIRLAVFPSTSLHRRSGWCICRRE